MIRLYLKSMYKKPKKEFPIKYMRRGLISEEDSPKEQSKKKGKRHIRKSKQSVHTKTGIGKNK